MRNTQLSTTDGEQPRYERNTYPRNVLMISNSFTQFIAVYRTECEPPEEDIRVTTLKALNIANGSLELQESIRDYKGNS